MSSIDWSSLWKKEDWVAVWIDFLIIILALTGLKVGIPKFRWTTDGEFKSGGEMPSQPVCEVKRRPGRHCPILPQGPEQKPIKLPSAACRGDRWLEPAAPGRPRPRGTANGRVELWPPDPALVPTGTGQSTLPGSGIVLDRICGLPLDTTTQAATDYTSLQSQYKACMGTNLPPGCTSTTALTRMQAARKEAREMILAFMPGAEPVPTTGGIKRHRHQRDGRGGGLASPRRAAA